VIRKVFSVRKKIKENNRRAGERITLLEREKIEVPQKIKDIYQEVFEYFLDLFLSEKELFIKETKNKSTNNKEKANMSADPDDKYIEDFLRKNILIAGGFISDLIIKNETKKETKIRDIDLYISPMVLEIYDKIVREKAPNKSIGERKKAEIIEEILGELEQLTKSGEKEKGERNEPKYETLEGILSVSEAKVKDIKVDLIIKVFKTPLDLVTNFDFTFRQACYNGKNLYISKRGLHSIREEELELNYSRASLSSYLRGLEFEKRYGFSFLGFYKLILFNKMHRAIQVEEEQEYKINQSLSKEMFKRLKERGYNIDDFKRRFEDDFGLYREYFGSKNQDDARGVIRDLISSENYNFFVEANLDNCKKIFNEQDKFFELSRPIIIEDSPFSFSENNKDESLSISSRKKIEQIKNILMENWSSFRLFSLMGGETFSKSNSKNFETGSRRVRMGKKFLKLFSMAPEQELDWNLLGLIRIAFEEIDLKKFKELAIDSEGIERWIVETGRKRFWENKNEELLADRIHLIPNTKNNLFNPINSPYPEKWLGAKRAEYTIRFIDHSLCPTSEREKTINDNIKMALDFNREKFETSSAPVYDLVVINQREGLEVRFDLRVEYSMDLEKKTKAYRTGLCEHRRKRIINTIESLTRKKVKMINGQRVEKSKVT